MHHANSGRLTRVRVADNKRGFQEARPSAPEKNRAGLVSAVTRYRCILTSRDLPTRRPVFRQTGRRMYRFRSRDFERPRISWQPQTHTVSGERRIRCSLFTTIVRRYDDSRSDGLLEVFAVRRGNYAILFKLYLS